jgi:hypothetical protein
MQPYRKYHILRRPTREDSIWQLKDGNDLHNYLSAVRTSEGLFSFCSACIVRRDKLLKTEPLEGANGTCWRYAARLISVAVSYQCSIVIANQFLVRKRGDNDSFAAGGVIKRLGIAICEWTRAIHQLKISDFSRAQMVRLVHSDISFLSMLYASQLTCDASERQLYDECVRQRFGGKSISDRFKRVMLLRVGNVGSFAPLVRVAKNSVQRLRRRMQQFEFERTRDGAI